MDDLRNLDQDDVKGLTVYLGELNNRFLGGFRKNFRKRSRKK